MMRVPAEFLVRAMLRRCSAAGVPAVVVRHGDDRAGSILVKVHRLDGTVLVWGPAPASLSGSDDLVPRSVPHLRADGVAEAEADAYLARQIEYDPDIWIVEIEDRLGRNFTTD